MTRKFGAPSQTSGNPGSTSLDYLAQVALTGPFNSAVDSGIAPAAVLAVLGLSELWSPLVTSWVRLRNADVFKDSFGSAAGQTPIWTPAAGKKFRLMAYWLSLTSNANIAAAAIRYARLVDGAAGTQMAGFQHNVFIPAAAGPTGPPLYSFVQTLPGNGYLSLAANNVLQLEIQAALVGGLWLIGMAGTEE